MHRRKFIVNAGATALAATAATTAGRALGQNSPQFKLKLHHLLGPRSPAHTLMLEPWAQRVAKATGGKVQIEIFPSMSLGGKPPDLIKQARDGVVDLVWTVNGYTPALFPRSEVFELPFVHTNNLQATNLAMREMFDKHLAPEYQGVKVMWLHVHAGQGIHMVDTPVRTPDDLKGKKIRIPTRTGAWLLEALGATPVGMPVPDLPQALSKKVVDGALVPWEIIPPLKLHELTKYQIEGKDRIRFGTTTFQVSMNEAKWKSLPPDIQKAIMEVSGESWWREVGKIWTDSEDVGIGLVKKAGHTHIELTDKEMEAFRAKLEPVVDRWIKEVSAKGIDGKELVDTARKTIAKYSK
ncbi:MAG: TRAP transporter substrate-binding protein [Alphaproteobacteria bacterium]|nr:TRAP transporter substrate-binding protein [Alphaproteobacteria bacterium]MCW5741930.1 TRAP transporter substrate-binding protein [Alphaproteobacteria bacterium]